MTNRENCTFKHVVINFLLSFTTVYNKTVQYVMCDWFLIAICLKRNLLSPFMECSLIVM